jgi:uncharacterized integral membrane protein
MKMSTKARIKLIVVTILVLLVVIVVLQNTRPVTTKILFFPAIDMPVAVFSFVTMAIGFVAGIVFSNVIRGR